MDRVWTAHRFAGGWLALDVANSVVMRHDPQRRFDRFAEPGLIDRFVRVLPDHCGEPLDGAWPVAARVPGRGAELIALREAIDCLFRGWAATGRAPASDLASLLSACSDALKREAIELAPGGAVAGTPSLAAATALSALRLLEPDRAERVRICDNCGWLFLDRSRNRSRRWCDMAVCGNRSKARRHYQRARAEGAEQ